MIPRRAFLISLGLTGFVVPSPTRAQTPGKLARVGYISNLPEGFLLADAWRKAFVDGLREHGLVENQNVVIERRYAEVRTEAAQVAVEELLRLNVDVIVVSSTLTALIAKKATTKVPIVVTVPADPVATGLVASLARPGGNVTGLSFVGTELAGKQVELLNEAVPGLRRVAVLANPRNASHAPRAKEILEVARTLKLQSDVIDAATPGAIRDAFTAMAKRRPGAAIVLSDPLFFREAQNLVRIAAEQRLPVMYALREIVVAGGLMSYGANFSDLFRRAATYVDKILKGASPSDLPVEQASKFELVINLNTAKALGLTMPQALLVRADEVIR
jgi:putative tryptophan/tyrosine transport system substrate-binding protein